MSTELPPDQQPVVPEETNDPAIISDEHLERIRAREGRGFVMSLEEVRALLGAPHLSKATLSRIRNGQNFYAPESGRYPHERVVQTVRAVQAATAAAVRRVIAWYARFPHTPEQEAAIRALYGEGAVLQPCGNEFDPSEIREHMQEIGAIDCVIVDSLTYLHDVLGQDILPLYAQMEECEQHAPGAVRAAGGRFFRFAKMRRLTGIDVQYADTLEPLVHPREGEKATVLWMAETPPKDDGKEQLSRLYNGRMHLRVHTGSYRNADHVRELVQSRHAHDAALVAPLSVYQQLTDATQPRGERIYPIRPRIERGRTVLQRVLGVTVSLDDAEALA